MARCTRRGMFIHEDVCSSTTPRPNAFHVCEEVPHFAIRIRRGNSGSKSFPHLLTFTREYSQYPRYERRNHYGGAQRSLSRHDDSRNSTYLSVKLPLGTLPAPHRTVRGRIDHADGGSHEKISPESQGLVRVEERCREGWCRGANGTHDTANAGGGGGRRHQSHQCRKGK